MPPLGLLRFDGPDDAGNSVSSLLHVGLGFVYMGGTETTATNILDIDVCHWSPPFLPPYLLFAICEAEFTPTLAPSLPLVGFDFTFLFIIIYCQF